MKKFGILFLIVILSFLSIKTTKTNFNIINNENQTSISSSITLGSISTIDVPVVNESNITFEENSDGKTATITNITIASTDKIINIPSEVDSKKKPGTKLTVTSIKGSVSSNVFGQENNLEIILPSTLTSFGQNAFKECDGIQSLDLSNITSIGDGAFQGCNALTSITFGNVSSVGQNAFLNCVSLTEVNLPVLTTLNNSAFQGCTLLETISLPALTKIGSSVFSGCIKLKDISFESLSEFKNGTSTESSSVFTGCTSLETVNLPNLTKISSSIFAGCASLDNLSFPKVTSIGDNSFQDCTSLTKIDLPALTSIGDSAFSGCTSLEYLFIQNKITSLGTDIVNSASNFKYFACYTKDIYYQNKDLFKTNYSDKISYKINVKYINVGLLNDSLFNDDFQNSLNNRIDSTRNDDNTVYTFVAGETLPVPTLTNLKTQTTYTNLDIYLGYLSGKFSNMLSTDGTSENGELNKKTLVIGIVGNNLTLYLNAYNVPTNNETFKNSFNVGIYDANFENRSASFTNDDLYRKTYLAFVSDLSSGISGLPIAGYAYTYTWYKTENTILIPLENDTFEPSVYKYIPSEENKPMYDYTCIIEIQNTKTNEIFTITKSVSMKYTEATFIVYIVNQTIYSNSTVSTLYAKDYIVSLRGKRLTYLDMNNYFDYYGIRLVRNGSNTEIVFDGKLKSQYASTYDIDTSSTGTLTILPASNEIDDTQANIIIIIASVGLFFLSLIIVANRVRYNNKL